MLNHGFIKLFSSMVGKRKAWKVALLELKVH